MVKSRLRWFEHIWRRFVEAPIRRADHIGGSPIARGRRRLRNITGETIRRNLEVNGLKISMIYDRILWRCLIYIVGPA